VLQGRGRLRPAARAAAVATLLAGLIAVAVAVAVASVVLLVGDASWRTAWRELADPAPAAALPDGPVMVLGGSPSRLPLALTLPGVPGPSRTLVVSGSAVEDWTAGGGSCTDPHVVCVVPDPSSTYGEAMALDRLARDNGWEAVTVITSQAHVARSRWQLDACAEVRTVVVAPGAGPVQLDRPRLERWKLVNAGLRTACR